MKQIKPEVIEQFCSKYIELGCNGAGAYKAIHPGATNNTAKVEAHRYLTNPNVQMILEPMIRSALDQAKVDRNWVITRLREQADASPLDYFKETSNGQSIELDVANLTPAQRRNLKSVKICRSEGDQSVTVTVCNQQRALSLLTRLVEFVGSRSNSNAQERIGDFIESGVNKIVRNKNLDAWRF